MNIFEKLIMFDKPAKEMLKKASPYLVLAVTASLLFSLFFDPISRNDSHSNRMWIAGLGIALLFYRVITKGNALFDPNNRLLSPMVSKVYVGILTVAIVFGVFNYYNFDKKEAVSIGDGSDMTYYYINTKYLHELGYYRLYAAMLTADKEYNDRYASKLKRYRDLRDYNTKPTNFAFEHGAEIKEKHFSKERWESFKHDVDYFMSLPSMKNIYEYFYSDHGYNPPPTWAVPGYLLAASAPAEYVKVIAMADVLIVVCMFGAIAWAFGAESSLLAMLFFLCTFSGRWPMLGQCLLRFDWSSSLIIGVCLLKKEKWAFAGALMSYAAFNRIFPALFFFPWLILAIVEIIRTRRIPIHHMRFVGGAAAVAVFLSVSAVVLFGTQTIKESSANLLMHNASFSSHRIGLGTVLAFDGETTRQQIREKGGLHAKELFVQSTKKLRNFLGILSLIFIGYYVFRVKKPVHELIHFSMIPLFMMTTPQVNYYNMRILLIIWHAANLKHGLFHQIGIIALFAIEVYAQWSHVSGVERFAVNAYASYGLLFYFLFVLAWMLLQTIKSKKAQTPQPNQ